MKISSIVIASKAKHFRGYKLDLFCGPWIASSRSLLAMTVKVTLVILVFCYMYLWNAQAKDIPPKPPEAKFSQDFSDEERELLDLTNKVRVKKNLPPLTMNLDLAIVAQEQSADMAHHHHLSHTVHGKHLGIRIKKSGYDYRTVGENIARSKGTLPHVIHMWLSSPGHRKNFLNPQFKEVGFGIATAKNGDRYFTQVFGTQR